MVNNKSGSNVSPIECLVNTGHNLVRLDAVSGGRSLYYDKVPGSAQVSYGQYLGSVARLLSENSNEALRNLCRGQHEPTPELEEASRIELISEKHGVLYSVSRLRIHFADKVRSFAVNCAFSPEQQAFLQVEVKLLSDLHATHGLPYLPVPFICASGQGMMLFITDWFENHHEFHLSVDSTDGPAVSLWKQDGKPHFIPAAQVPELYAQASKILTLYLDSRSFSQIYPWHHAAGDFVMDDSQSPLSLRLITVRGYRPLLARRSDRRDKMLGSLHFFVNLCVRMRIDRLDGTGDLAWAGPQCLPGVIGGFVEAWETKAEGSDLPKANEIFSLFLALSPDERLAFAKIAAEDGRVEEDEGDFVIARLTGHVMELSEALENFKF
jgi:hypothetical protein